VEAKPSASASFVQYRMPAAETRTTVPRRLSWVSKRGWRRKRRTLKRDFDNGEPYYPLDGREIWVPASVEARPSRELLEWHADSVFRG
jgi:hypothetical protein